MNKLLWALLLSLCITDSAWAVSVAGTPQNEIIYRTHLGRADDVKLLITQGASPNLTNDAGVPLLSLAASRKDKEGLAIMSVLLAAGANINATDTEGQTALFHAARQGNKDAAMLLLESGIQYYVVDNNGDVARNLAHREGHKELLVTMDAFVTGEGAKRKAEYEAYHRSLQDRQEEERKAIEAQHAAETKKGKEEFDEAVARNKELESLYKEEFDELQKAREEDRDALLAKREEDIFEQKLEDIAFHTCAFQYWSYCKSLNQTTEISKDEVNVAIDTHQDTVEELRKELAEEYELTEDYIDGIINRSKKRIFSQLSRMPSKSYRFEHGVGKMEDMRTRCTDVAKLWNDKSITATEEEQSIFKRKKRRR